MNFRAFAEAFKICVDSFIRLSNHVKRELPSSLTTVGLLIFLYAGSAVIAEGDFISGMQRAFSLSDVSKEELLRERQAEKMQIKLHNTMFVNQQISERLSTFLENNPSVARIRIGVIHNGTFTITGTSLLKFDITHAEAKPGRFVGEFISNMPLKQWNDFLDVLVMQKDCTFVETKSMKEQAAFERERRLAIKAFLACPILNGSNQILGGLFVSWDDGDTIPEDKTKIIQDSKLVAAQIGVALEPRPNRN